ncbi:hypothetical protein GGI23_003093 [Coemansia sp. RSA 2559]|nr:hypothetical protein GGI23_003093 [Coemansia sp. RSA 2559]
MTSPSASSRHSDPARRPISPQQMASRLRTRLRMARATIERELGHPMTTFAPQAAHGSPLQSRYSPLHRRHRNGVSILRGLTARAHSYSHGDFPALHRRDLASGYSRLSDNAPVLGSSSTSTLLRHQSALSPATAHSASAMRSCRPGTTPTAVFPLEIPSSPPDDVLHTPQMLPLDYENEAAHTILMLATPPAVRAPPISASPPCTVQKPNRRLSFSKCAPSLSPSSRPTRARPTEKNVDDSSLSQTTTTATHASRLSPCFRKAC